MAEFCYQIKSIPDLTLGKYNYLAENGVDGVLSLHDIFLRLLHEKSLISKLSYHLLYSYDPQEAQGKKLKIFFIVSNVDCKNDNIEAIISGSSLSKYFTFELVYYKEDNLIDGELPFSDNEKYSFCSTVAKEEIFFTPSTTSSQQVFYDVPVWKPNSDGRLYDMFNLM